MVRMILDRKPDGSPQHLPIKTDFLYIDDDATPDPPEFVPGQSPNMGFWMSGFEDLPRGTLYFYLISYMVKGPYYDGLIEDYLNIMDHQIRAFVH